MTPQRKHLLELAVYYRVECRFTLRHISTLVGLSESTLSRQLRNVLRADETTVGRDGKRRKPRYGRRDK